MEEIKLEKLSFIYPGREKPALCEIDLSVASGEFFVLFGPSGSGKSTLLRLLKPSGAAFGTKSGEILFEGKPLDSLDRRSECSLIGFVSQSAENRIVTDKVWHELAFGLESLGLDSGTIRRRVAEMASFFGISSWYYKNVSELSGGQKQLLNLASVMVMQPRVLILDEPTAQLDPIAASDFLAMAAKINRELGTTVIMTEHRLEEAFSYADRAAFLDAGKLVCCGKPPEIGEFLRRTQSPMFLAMPCAMRAWAATQSASECPVTVREGRDWLQDYSNGKKLAIPEEKFEISTDSAAAISAFELCFRYEKDEPCVVNGLSLEARKGELLAILGENGSGKSTSLKLLSGTLKPQSGKVTACGRVSMLPQDPRELFVKKTVREDLFDALPQSGLTPDDGEENVRETAALCGLTGVMDSHPYDLSGGEQQRAALAKILIRRPDVILLDEPTKGLDAGFKTVLADILKKLKNQGISIVMVSHDVEFCAEYADRCALFFDGAIVSTGCSREFFLGNSFYTTAANRMSRGIADGIVTTGELEKACGGAGYAGKCNIPDRSADFFKDVFSDKPASGAPFSDVQNTPEKKNGKDPSSAEKNPPSKQKLSKRTRISCIAVLLLIPLTLFLGTFVLSGRKYYFVMLLVLLECMAPFFIAYEGRKPKPKELVILGCLVAIGVAGRAAFFMLPEFKPVIAVTVIAGVAFGGESGFLTGALIMFVSNLMFGHGPWTPWQMFSMGLIGFIAGVLFRKGRAERSRMSLAVFGALSSVVIYGGIMNPVSGLLWTPEFSWKILLSYYAAGFPLDCVRAAATAFFLWLAAEPMLEKLDRIKTKYGVE